MTKIIFPALFALLYFVMSKFISFEAVVFIALGSMMATLCEIERKVNR